TGGSWGQLRQEGGDVGDVLVRKALRLGFHGRMLAGALPVFGQRVGEIDRRLPADHGHVVGRIHVAVSDDAVAAQAGVGQLASAVGIAGQRGRGGGGRCGRCGLRRGGRCRVLGGGGIGFGRGGLLRGRGGFLRRGAVRQRGQREHGGEAGGDRQRARHGVVPQSCGCWLGGPDGDDPGRRAIAAV